MSGMNTQWTSVEKAFIGKSGRKESYKGEQIPVVEVQNVYELGQLVAVAFLEWVSENPSGVIALPTGRTPSTSSRRSNAIGRLGGLRIW